MFLKIKLRNEIYKSLEKHCKKNNIGINDFIEKIILEKVEMEMIKGKLKAKDISQIIEDEFVEDEIELLENYLDMDDKIKH